MDTIELSGWIHNLENQSVGSDAKDTPALTLLDFFRVLLDDENISGIDVSAAMEASKSLRRLEPVTVAMMDTWLQQWGYAN